MSSSLSNTAYNQWLADLKDKIRNSQLKAALKVNAELLSLYWELGAALTAKQKDSDWGDKIITQLAKDLSSEFPEIKGFSRANLFNIRKWYQFYHDSALVQQPVGQLPEIGQQAVDQIVQQPVGQIHYKNVRMVKVKSPEKPGFNFLGSGNLEKPFSFFRLPSPLSVS